VASRPADQRLRTYRGKRDFARTPEPEGAAGGPDRGRFVVQRHRARRLHYDFRLEVNGVLASWAVPKGPTLDPSVRRLAVHVEDHPIEYRDFEGVIPAGEYGGGDVIVWDRGTWTPVDTADPARAIADGELHFDLDGEKLKGRFVLVRTGHPADGSKEQWILLKKRDGFAQPGWDPEAHPASVKSGRSNEETAADPDAMWDSDAPADRAEVRFRPGDTSPTAHDATPGEVRALNALAADGSWSVGGTAVALTDLDRILWPAHDGEQAVTKRDLVRYYASTSPGCSAPPWLTSASPVAPSSTVRTGSRSGSRWAPATRGRRRRPGSRSYAGPSGPSPPSSSARPGRRDRGCAWTPARTGRTARSSHRSAPARSREPPSPHPSGGRSSTTSGWPRTGGRSGPSAGGCTGSAIRCTS